MPENTILTEEQKKKYVAGDGSTCPACDSNNIEGEELETDVGGAWQPIACNACGFRWNEVYSLITIEEAN